MAGNRGGVAGSPAKVALKRIAELVQRGAAPDRVGREVSGIVAAWRADPGSGEVSEILETLRDELAAGVEDAAVQAEEVDRSSAAEMRAAERTLAALVAARDAAVAGCLPA